FTAQYLHGTDRPAVALEQVARRVVGCQAAGEDLVVIGAGPALAVHPDRGVDVLGHAVDAHAADRAERVDPDHRARPAPERRTPAVLRGGDHAIEDRLFIEDLAVTPPLMLERFEVIEVLRGLG